MQEFQPFLRFWLRVMIRFFAEHASCLVSTLLEILGGRDDWLWGSPERGVFQPFLRFWPSGVVGPACLILGAACFNPS